MRRKILWVVVSFFLVAALVLSSCGEAVPGRRRGRFWTNIATTPGRQGNMSSGKYSLG